MRRGVKRKLDEASGATDEDDRAIWNQPTESASSSSSEEDDMADINNPQYGIFNLLYTPEQRARMDERSTDHSTRMENWLHRQRNRGN